MFRGSGTDNEKGRIEGPIYWFRIIAFQSGDIIKFARGTELPITDLAAYQSTRGWDYLALSPTTIIEYSNDKCEIPAVTAGSINASGASGNVLLPTIQAAGNSSGNAGADMNSNDWFGAATRYSTWINVLAFNSITAIVNLLNQIDSTQTNIQFSVDGSQAAQNDLVDGATGIIAAGTIPGGSPTTSRVLVCAPFVRLKIAKGGALNNATMRVRWMGCLGA